MACAASSRSASGVNSSSTPSIAMQFGELLGQRVLGLGQNGNQLVFGQFRQHRHHRQAPDEFGNETEAQQIFRLDVLQNFVAIDRWRSCAPCSTALKPITCLPSRRWMIFSRPTNAPPQMNKMSARVHADVFLLRMLASALRRHIANRAFQNFQQRLLHAFAGNVARDGDVLRLARDLVDFVNVNDAASARASRRNRRFAAGAE